MQASEDASFKTHDPGPGTVDSKLKPQDSKLKALGSSVGWSWILVGLTILLTASVRVRLREMPLERDEGEYAYAGQLILHGVPPYKEAYNMKLPGTYLAYAFIMAVFGQSPSAIHVGVALINAASIVLVFLLGWRLLDEAAGVVAAVSFGLLSLSPTLFGLAGHATHFVLLPALMGMVLLTSTSLQGATVSGRWSRSLVVFVAGFLFGLGFLMKQHGIFFGLFGAAYLLVTESRGSRVEGRASRSLVRSPVVPWSRSLVIFAAGFVLPYFLTCLVLWATGVFHQFVFWTISYAGRYASAAPLVNGPELLKAGVEAVIGPNIVLWLLPWVGLLMMWWEERLGNARSEARSARSEPKDSKLKTQNSKFPSPHFFLMGLLFCSIASASVGLYFRGHYFILMLPVLALLTGVAVSRALHLVRHDRSIELLLAAAIVLLFLVAVGAALIGNGSVWFSMSPAQASRDIYHTTLFSESVRAGDYLKAHTAKESRIAVLGSEPEIYFYAHRRSASGNIYMYPLMEGHDLALKMQKDMIAEIERNRPEYVVYVEDNLSWLANPKSERRLDSWWRGYWATNLDLAMTIDFEEIQENKADEPAAAASLPSGQPGAASIARNHMFILKQRQGN